MIDSFDSWFTSHQTQIVSRLIEFINIETTSPHEPDCHGLLSSWLREIGAELCFEQLPGAIATHPARACFDHQPPLSSQSLFSARYPAGARFSESLLFSGHLDVVPAGAEFPRAFEGYEEAGVVHGRGACDTKNNIVMVIEALRYLRAAGKSPSVPVILDFPFEEEIGGCGALARSLVVDQPLGSVCLEPTSLQVYRGHRGCVSIEILVEGEGVHMGSPRPRASAIDGAFLVTQALKRLEKSWIEEARASVDFAAWERPLQINVGYISGGQWHGSVPESCKLGCNVGFLPPRSVDKVVVEVRTFVAQELSREGFPGTFSVRCNGLRNEGYVQPAGTALEQRLLSILQKQGVSQDRVSAWNVSCDGRLYASTGSPTLIFGCGSLADAHSNHERVSIEELKAGVRIISELLS